MYVSVRINMNKMVKYALMKAGGMSNYSMPRNTYEVLKTS
jgi:hypothetical protein